MKLTKEKLRQIIHEELQDEGLRDFVKGAFSSGEEKSLFQKVFSALNREHNMYINERHPLYAILQKADEADLESLLDRLEHPFGAGVKRTRTAKA